MRAKAHIQLIRPWQWVKNGFVFLPLLFAGRILDGDSLACALIAFASFCLVASGVYCLNDYADREADRNHPEKCNRPIASGAVRPGMAVALGCALAVAGLAVAFSLNVPVALIAALYLVNNVLYSTVFKHVAVIDVLSVSAGFLLRIFAGIFAIDCYLSPWIVLCTSFLALFLAIAKRLSEFRAADESDTATTRKVLDRYTERSLEGMLLVTATLAIMSYSLYTITASVSQYMMLTIPFVIYGVFRYLILSTKSRVAEAPDKVLLTDAPTLVDVVAWLVCCGVILYLG